MVLHTQLLDQPFTLGTIHLILPLVSIHQQLVACGSHATFNDDVSSKGLMNAQVCSFQNMFMFHVAADLQRARALDALLLVSMTMLSNTAWSHMYTSSYADQGVMTVCSVGVTVLVVPAHHCQCMPASLGKAVWGKHRHAV